MYWLINRRFHQFVSQITETYKNFLIQGQVCFYRFWRVIGEMGVWFTVIQHVRKIRLSTDTNTIFFALRWNNQSASVRQCNDCGKLSKRGWRVSNIDLLLILAIFPCLKRIVKGARLIAVTIIVIVIIKRLDFPFAFVAWSLWQGYFQFGVYCLF